MYYLNFPEEKSKYPCFVLDPDEWDDYSYRIMFGLYYCENYNNKKYIGNVKIIHKQLELEQNQNHVYVKDIMKKEFSALDDNFASLGQKREYYENIRCLPEKYSVMDDLRDCGYNNNYLLGFSEHLLDNRLLRFPDAEKMYILGRFIVTKKDPATIFHFNLNFSPEYNKESENNITFNLDHKDSYFPNSIYCIIGENGSGKTQLLKSFPAFLQKNNIPCNRIIHITNNLFEKKVKYNYKKKPEYIYLGVLDDNLRNFKKSKSLKSKLLGYLKQLIKKYCEDSYSREKIDTFLKRIASLYESKIDLFPLRESLRYNDYNKKDPEYFTAIINNIINDFTKLSSGESILFMNLIRLILCIQHFSLFLIDEPEIYLHPNFITEYMRFLYLLLKDFNSVAVIATHSVFVIREIKSSCVYTIQREGNNCSIEKIPRETLGANAMTICEDVFRISETPSNYMKQISKMKEKNYSESEILNSLISRNDKDLDLGLKLYLHSLFSEQK